MRTYLLSFLSIFIIVTSFQKSDAQSVGDFRSASSGDWSSTGTWEIWNGATWNAAGTLPTSSTSVYIQDGDSVYLSSNASCKDLHLNSDINGSDSARLTLTTFTLAVSGKLRTYTGSHGTIPGTNATGANNSARFLSTTTGKIQITGTSHDVTVAGEWGVPLNCRNWDLEIAMNSASDVATFKTNLRAGNITVAAGNLTMDVAAGGALRPDGGSAGTGTLTVNSGATLTLNSVTIARTASERFATFNLNSGANLVIPSGATGKIAATTVNLNGTVTCNSTTMLANGGITSAASTNTYFNLTTGTAISLTSAITVSGTLTLGSTLTTTSSNSLTLGSVAVISGASSTNYIIGPLSMTVAATNATKVFEIGKGSYYRKFTLTVTHTDATPTIYTAELFNSAPTSRTLGTLTNVSNIRYWNVTKGAGSTVVSASAGLTYGADDGVGNHTGLKVAKDDGAGNWVDLAGTGATSLTGTITSSSFTTFNNDFVLANVTQLNSGDFRSLQTGDWSSTTTWETWNGSAWVAAGSIPTSTTSVYLQDGDSVYLSANSSCYDLHFNSDINGSDSARLTIGSFTLSVFGKLRTYTGAKGNIPGANSTGVNNSLRFLSTTGAGKLQITGVSRDVTTTGEWGVPLNCRSWDMEISMNTATDVATFKTNLRMGNLTVANGVMTMDVTAGGAIRPDGGSAGTGTLTINSGATLNMNSATMARTATERFGTFTLNSGGILNLPSGTTCKLSASTVNLNGTVTTSNGGTLGNGGLSGAASTDTYTNLTANAAVTLSSAITVNGTLTLNAKITTTSSNLLTMGSSGTISGASSSNYVDGPLAMTIAATNATKTFEIGKGSYYRKLALTVTHTTATATVYTAEVFNAAPTSRTLGSLTNVSNTRYWNVAKGSGATVTAASVALTYGADDGVSSASSLKIAQDDGAGNWVDLAGTGATALTGTITSSNNFTHFGADFVLANITQLNNGDFRSKQTGNWSSTSTWETWNGSAWVSASSTPTSTNNVYLQDGDSVYLSTNSACNDLHFNSDIDAADSARLTLTTFDLAVSGKLRTYTGAKGNIPGSNSTGLNNSLRFLSCTTGKIQITGTSRDVTSAGEWGVPLNCRNWNLEITMNSASDVATFKTNLRAGAITVNVGSLTMDVAAGGALRPDGGSAGTGTLTINSGATLNMNSVTVARTASERFGTFTLNTGGILNMPSGATCKVAASTVTLNGTVVSNNGGTLGNGGIASAATTTTYATLTINAATTLSQAIAVNGTLNLNAIMTTTSTNNLIMGAGSSIAGASTTAFINGPLSIQNTSTASNTALTFHIGKGTDYRPVVLTITQSSGSATTYTAEMFNAAPTSRTLPGTLHHVSPMRYFNVTNGGPSGITAGKLTITYESDDGVNQTSQLRVAKDNGAGAWLDLGGTGTGSPSGFIQSTTNFTSFSDFVLANTIIGTNPLPVTFASFDAERVGPSEVLLSWATASEQNNKGFAVQRATDNASFDQIDFVNSKLPNSSVVQNYTFNDMDADAGSRLYYRLQQFDYDGKSTYSAVKMVDAGKTNGSVTVYPNPAKTELTVKLNIQADTKVELSSMGGQVLYATAANEMQQAEGLIRIPLQKIALQPGIYLLKVSDRTQTHFNKIVIR